MRKKLIFYNNTAGGSMDKTANPRNLGANLQTMKTGKITSEYEKPSQFSARIENIKGNIIESITPAIY